MIKSGNSPMHESVSGDLAGALKGMDKKVKNRILNHASSLNIDFDRSIGKAEKIKPNDPRLQVAGNLVIGVYNDSNDKKCVSVYEVGKGPIIETNAKTDAIKNAEGNLVKVPNFANVSWKKWVEIMTAFYIIEKSKAVPVRDLRIARRDAKTPAKQIDEKLTAKVLDTVTKAGYSIRTSFLGVDIRNLDNSAKVSVHYDPKQKFMIDTTGTWLDEKDANKYLKDFQNALNLAHFLNQVNFDKVSIREED